MKRMGLLVLALLVALCAVAPAAMATTINVGSEGVYSPFTYVDESGKLTGYDIEVVRLLDEVMEDYEFEFVQVAWDGIFTALDSGRIDMIANNLGRTPSREEKYTFADLPYLYAYNTIITAPDNTEINTIEDLTGKKVGSSVGNNFTAILEEYLAQNGNLFEISYYDGNFATVLQDLIIGRVDATFNSPFAAQDIAKSMGIEIRVAGAVGTADSIHFLARKDEEGQALCAALDAALKTVIEDGRLSALCVEWFGEDYTKAKE